MDNRPIGVFDSGLGGLTVVKEIKNILPNEKIIYLGDTARVPYGTRSKETIIKFAKEDIKFLMGFNVKCIVIACNTVSSVASEILKKEFKVPIFDVITPTCTYISKINNIKKVGVIGTSATIKSNSYKFGIAKLNNKLRVIQNPSPLLVPLIEENEVNSKFTYDILKKYLKPLLMRKIDILVLGCTHYPLVIKDIKKILGKIKIINPAKFVSIELKKYLFDNNLNAHGKMNSSYKYFVTDLAVGFVKQFSLFLGTKEENKLAKVNLDKYEI